MQVEEILRSGGNLLEHFQSDLAIGDLAQGCHAWLVLRLDLRGVPLAQHARTVSGSQHELKAVGDFFEAVFDRDAGHGQNSETCAGNASGNAKGLKHFRPGSALGRVLEALRVNDGFEIEKRTLEQLIDYNEIE